MYIHINCNEHFFSKNFTWKYVRDGICFTELPFFCEPPCVLIWSLICHIYVSHSTIYERIINLSLYFSEAFGAVTCDPKSSFSLEMLEAWSSLGQASWLALWRKKGSMVWASFIKYFFHLLSSFRLNSLCFIFSFWETSCTILVENPCQLSLDMVRVPHSHIYVAFSVP